MSSEMSGKYSEKKFFFAHYGCCIPTEQYAWMLVVLFVSTILVLLFCMLATATIRWMYKRRMRKRLHDLKKKYLEDQAKAQEFEAKLNRMAQKNKSVKGSGDDSGAAKEENITIFVDPEEQKRSEKKKKAMNVTKRTPAYPAIVASYDPDETPIAQSTLASQSNTVEPQDRWIQQPKAQKMSRGVSPTLPSPVQIVALPIQNYDPNDIPDGDAVASDSAPAEKKFVPQSTTTEFTTTTEGSGSATVGSGDTTPDEKTGTSGTSDKSVTIFSTLPPPTSSSSSAGVTSNGSPGEEVRQHVQYGQNEIVTPPNPEEQRKEGAGGRNEWKYYYANGEKHTSRRAPSTTVTKTTSSSHRPSSRSWLFDSTGSSRFDAGREGSSRSSSILKTDSSQYKTASIEQFPHGAFTFQQ